MANKTIGELPEADQLTGDELIHLIQDGNSRRSGVRRLLEVFPPLQGHLYRLALSNNSTDPANDIEVAAGACASDEPSPILMAFAGGTERQVDVAYGTGNGARFDATVSDGTWHQFIISDGTNVSFGMSKSLNPTGQANYPAGFTHYRRIASIVRVSGSFVGFIQRERWFIRKDGGVLDVNAGNGAVATSATSVAISVPTGISVLAKLAWKIGPNNFVNIWSPDAPDQSPSYSGTGLPIGAPVPVGGVGGFSSSVPHAAGMVDVWTNTSAQVRYVAGRTDGPFFLSATAWLDPAI